MGIIILGLAFMSVFCLLAVLFALSPLDDGGLCGKGKRDE